MTEERSTGGSRWRQKVRGWRPVHSGSLNESINEVESRKMFSMNEMTEERSTGGSRWREKGRGWRPDHRRCSDDSMGL